MLRMSHLGFVFALAGMLLLGPDRACAQEEVKAGGSTPPRAEPVIEPDAALAKSGRPLSNRALVTTPPFIKGVLSWSLETKNHRGTFSVTALSPDGKLLATGGLDGTIRLWDLATGNLVRALIGHDSYVYGLAFSPAGRYLASGGSFDGTARIWEVSTGQPLKILRGHPGYLVQVAWTPDGRKLVGAGDGSGDISVWEIATGLKVTKGSLGQYILSIAVHPDGARAAAVTSESAVIVVDLKTGKSQRSLGEVANKYFSLGWSPDGNRLAAGAAKATYVHDEATGKIVVTLDSPGHVLSWAADGSRLATASQADATIKLWNPTDGSLIHKISATATSLHLQSGNSRVVVGDTHGITVANLADGKQVARYQITGAVPPVWTSKRPVLTGMGTPSLSLWEPGTGKLLRALDGHTGGIAGFAWSPDGKALATAAYDKTVRVWDAGTATVRHTLAQHTAAALCVAWSPDGKEIASGGQDKKVLVWDAKTGMLIQTLAAHDQDIPCLAWSPSGGTLAAAVRGGNVFLYPRSTWKQSKPLATKAQTSPSALAWSADGKILAVGDSNGAVILWPLPKGGAPLAEFPTSGSPPYISSMVFYPKGDVLACGRGNHTLDLWSLKTLKKITTAPTMAPVQHVNWSASGPLLAVASADRTCRFFEPASARLKGVLLAEPEQMVAVSADGHYHAEGPALDRLIYVVQTEKGQDTFPPAEFAAKYAWKNNAAAAQFAGK